jgi:serine/threonine-protein kinase
MALGLNKDTKRTLVKLLAAIALIAVILGGFAACLFTVRSTDEATQTNAGPALQGSFKVDIGPTATPNVLRRYRWSIRRTRRARLR